MGFLKTLQHFATAIGRVDHNCNSIFCPWGKTQKQVAKERQEDIIRELTIKMLNWDDLLEPMLMEFGNLPETEHNWQIRQSYLQKLKARLEAATGEVPRNFWDKIKLMYPFFITTAASERTQLSKDALDLINMMFRTQTTQMHPYLEATIPTLLQIAGSAKKQNQINGNVAMNNVVHFSGYNHRVLYHVCSAFNDKRKDARANAPAWLYLFLETNRHNLDPTKDYPVIEKALNTGLNDGDVKTRETTRRTYWLYYKINQSGADAIMATLNTHASNALKSHKGNPDKTSAPVKAPRPESALAKIKAQKSKAATAVPPPPPPPEPVVPQVEKPFLAAPVRRPRIIATPIIPQRGPQTQKKPSEKPQIHMHKKSSSSDIRRAPEANVAPTHSHSSSSSSEIRRAPEAIVAPIVSHSSSSSDIRRAPEANVASTASHSSSTSKPAESDSLIKARRSLPGITTALKEGKLDALGYRKLKKLIMTYPGQLFTDGGVDDQYDALYRALISQFCSAEEAVEPREQQRANLNHPIYTRMTVMDILESLMLQYPYGEPMPGQTLVALLRAKACYSEERRQMTEKIRKLMVFYLNQILERFNPLPVIDLIVEALFELSLVIISNEPQNVKTPTWQRVLDLSSPHGLHEQHISRSIMSDISDFAPVPPKTPSRLPPIMKSGVRTLTNLVLNAQRKGYLLSDIQQQSLIGLLSELLTTYRQLFKQEIMEFASALFDIIKPEARFKELFTNESDLNLAYYCIGRKKNNHRFYDIEEVKKSQRAREHSDGVAASYESYGGSEEDTYAGEYRV